MSALAWGTVGLAPASWVVGLLSYLRMMGGLPPAIVKLHCARLRVRANLLVFACPEIFVGKSATYRRLYIGAMLAFAISVVAGAWAVSVLQPR